LLATAFITKLRTKLLKLFSERNTYVT